jgi:AraC-like DNA-binding protein
MPKLLLPEDLREKKMSITTNKQISSKETLATRKTAVKRVIKTVNEKLDEPLTMDEMARIAYMSPFHFNRVFHQVTGLPPKQFLYAMRLESAKRLLLTTDKSVTEICFEVGYNSLGTFTTRFTELVGLSPRELRYLADKIHAFDWDKLYNTEWENVARSDSELFLQGTVHTPEGFEGLIFVGLFEQMIPQSQPVSGTLLTRGGKYQLNSVSDGTYNLLVAALPRSDDPLDYLLLEMSKLLVGTGETAIEIKNGEVSGETDLTIRHLKVTDPPILIALPSLLLGELQKITSQYS